MTDEAPTSPPLLEELAACLRVLRAVEHDRSVLTQLSAVQRRELLTLAGLVSKPERHDLVKMAKAFRRAEREATKQRDRQAIAQAGLRLQRRAEVYKPLWLEPPHAEISASVRPELDTARGCYVCKAPYTEVHRYYDAMCAACGDFNYSKRSQTADLEGQYALVTGARVKIGYQSALLLLRAGAHVVVVTRFPIDAAGRYAHEPDYPAFRDRLQIHGLDLRHTPSVELFARYLAESLPRLDHIVNNACQTVRRPAGFFKHLLAREAGTLTALPPDWRTTLRSHGTLIGRLGKSTARIAQDLSVLHGAAAGEGIIHSAALSQRHYLDEDYADGATIFPRGQVDEDLQQVDLRRMNSWRLRLHEVQTPELLEVQLVNAIAPYILNARLKPLLVATPGRHKHIVNVSAMEGQFYRTTKTDKHPHTNMAKAALNMMTRTSAPDYVKDGIHMNAVDTGWVTDEDPAVHAARKAEEGFAPPLDIIDGAARVIDPIFSGINTANHVWGQFLKDYRSTPW
jgi:NAD(P)-dependent dehydrogenase (short-subunit alcohol dehydrogenase family)